MKYEISYESETTSGTWLVDAQNDEQALKKFADGWSQWGDDVPTHWISGRISVNY